MRAIAFVFRGLYNLFYKFKSKPIYKLFVLVRILHLGIISWKQWYAFYKFFKTYSEDYRIYSEISISSLGFTNCLYLYEFLTWEL